MSTIKQLDPRSMLSVAALILILGAIGLPGISQTDRANDAWSERLTKQAGHLQEAARAARAADAWSERLNGLAAMNLHGFAGFEEGPVGMSDRAIGAWADRLTGLADYYAALERDSGRE